MGTSLACVCATIYYSCHEELEIFPQFGSSHDGSHPLMLHGRLIDDTIQNWDVSKLHSGPHALLPHRAVEDETEFWITHVES